MQRKIFLLLLLPTLSFGQKLESNQHREIVFESVNVIPMDREQVLENQTVIVKGGRITYAGPAAKAKVAKDALVVPAKGKYLMPGLAEIHAHVPPIDNLEPMKDVLQLYLAGGVTTIRGMLGHPRHLELRSKINAGEILGPHFYTSGPSLSGLSVKTAERGAAMVREQKEAGYDFLKLHPGLTKETFAAISKTAKEVGIPFSGHVSFSVGVWTAIDAGYSTIDHMDGFIEAITPGIDTLAEQQTGLFGSWIAHRADETQIPKLASALAEKKIWVVPTQALAERWLSANPASEFLAAPEMVYMKPEDTRNWETAKNNYLNHENFLREKANRLIQVRRKMIAECQKSGVGLLLGSDAPQVFNVPGFSVHHELFYLVEAGLTPYQALQTGTINVARYLGKTDSGTIATGNVSDLILLGANPLENIRATSKIEGVMIGQNLLSDTYLSQMLAALKKQ